MPAPSRLRARLQTWLWIWLGWTALGVFFAISLWLNYVATGREARFGASLTVSLTEWWIWALLTPVPLLLAARFPLTGQRRGRAIAVHLAAAVLLALSKVLAERVIRLWIFGVAPYFLPSNLALHFLVYWAIVALAHGAAYYRRSREEALRAAEMEARANAARLEALDARLQPHFLYNALNTIAETVHEDPDKADRMIAGLADLLRASLDAGGPTTPLADELALVGRYLAIQQVRFDDRLRVEIDVPADLTGDEVPRLLLQPLVENAIHHGLRTRPEGGAIAIRARSVGDMLELVVEDDGDGPGTTKATVDEADSGGIGLANTQARLDVLYRGRARIELAARPGGGAVTTVRLPRARP
jgi:signal transduction histidine kinase